MSLHILAVDDEPLSLYALCEAVQEALPFGVLHSFSSAKSALEYSYEHTIDIAFLDIALGVSDGVSLACNLRSRQAHINVIFVTGYSEYTKDAMALHASGYIVKPVTTEKVLREVQDLRYPIPPDQADVFLHTFGDFELFIGQEAVTFAHKKTKELLALLTDRRGAFCSNALIISTLWEDSGDGKDSYLRILRHDLVKTLERYNKEDIIVRRYGEMAIDATKVMCDYWDYLSGKNSALYMGEYMRQYSWAEQTNAFLFERTKRERTKRPL